MSLTTCGRCGETLTAEDSIAVGLGAGCRRRVLAEALAHWKSQQVDKAREAVELGAVVPLNRDGAYAVASSDGSQFYIADAVRFTCTCRAAECGRLCYHVAAALIARLGPAPVLAQAA